MNQLNSTKRKEKNSWLTGLLFLFLLGSGLASIFLLYQVNNEFKVVVQHEMPITAVISRITVHKLEQSSWLERALRHADIAARSQRNDEENTRLLNESKAKFQEIADTVREEIDDALVMITEAQKRAKADGMRNEFSKIEQSLLSIREEYAAYINNANDLLALFVRGNLSDAEQAANETEKREEDFNQRLESFLFESERNSQRFLSSIEEREGKVIILIAMIISIALLLTLVLSFFNYVSVGSRKARTSRDGSHRK